MCNYIGPSQAMFTRGIAAASLLFLTIDRLPAIFKEMIASKPTIGSMDQPTADRGISKLADTYSKKYTILL
jgi:hypothetical protein